MKQKFLEEFKKLIKTTEVGIYNSCDVLEVFGIDKNKKITNLFSLFTFENSNKISIEEEYLTNQLQDLCTKSETKIGAIHRRISLDKAEEIFLNLLMKNDLGESHLGANGQPPCFPPKIELEIKQLKIPFAGQAAGNPKSYEAEFHCKSVVIV